MRGVAAVWGDCGLVLMPALLIVPTEAKSVTMSSDDTFDSSRERLPSRVPTHLKPERQMQPPNMRSHRRPRVTELRPRCRVRREYLTLARTR
jgi:hypothetical protein